MRTPFLRWALVLVLLAAAGASARDRAPLTVVGSESYAPLYFRDDYGQAAGLLVDLWTLWSEKTGEPIVFVNMPWAEGLEEVASRDDAVIAGFMHTNERELRYDFTIPFYRIYAHAFYHRARDPVEEPSQLDGETVGVVAGDYAETFLAQQVPGATLVPFARYRDLIRGALNGEVEVFVTDTPIALYHLREIGGYETFRYSSRPFYTSEIHAGVRQGETALLARVDAGLRAIRAEEIDALEAHWTRPRTDVRTMLRLLAGVMAVMAVLWLFVWLWTMSLRKKVRAATREIERAKAMLEERVAHRTRELAKSERQMRAIFDSAPWGLMIYRLDEADRLIFSGANRAASEILSVDCSQFVGKTLEKAFPPLAETEIPDRYRDAAREGTPWSSETVEYSDQVICGAFEVQAFQTAQDEMAVAFQDVTERKRWEDSLLRQAQMIDQVNGAVISLSLEGEIETWPKAAERLFGHTAAQAHGKPLRLLYPDFEHEAVERRVLRPLMARGEHEAEINMVDRTGRVFPAYQSLSLMRDSLAVPVGIIVFSIDITTRRIAERERDRLAEQLRQSQKMEAVGTLAGGIAHDFNNLLHIISGYAEQLAEVEGRDTEHTANVDGILRAAERAGRLVRGLLTFSRKMDARMIPTDPRQLLELTLEILRRTLPKSVELNAELPGELPWIQGDEALLEQVLLNLANNAVDAMPEGGRLTFQLRAPGHHGDAPPPPSGGLKYLLITVSDSGSGMDEPTMASMYEPFFSTKEKGRGTGLGLSTVYGILREHEGHIRCESHPGEGTAFHLYLPLANEEPAPEPVEPVYAPEPSSERGGGSVGKTILVVDDEPDVLKLTAEALEGFGYRVLTAASGEEALEAHQRQGEKIDLTLLDLGMPGMGGAACLKKLLERDPGVRVIIASGFIPQGPGGPKLPEGAAGMLNKPYRLKALREQIAQLLGTSG